MFQALPRTRSAMNSGVSMITLHVNDANRHVRAFGDLADDLQFRVFSAGHFDVNFIGRQIEKGGEHRRVAAATDGMSLEVPEAKMGGKTALARDGFDCAIEDVDEASRIFLVSCNSSWTAHPRSVPRSRRRPESSSS